MKKHHFYAIVKMIGGAAFIGLIGCSSTEVAKTSTVVQERYIPADPGAVEFVWEPPMVDVIDVPPGIDPEGIYYRPAHQSVVEIRQGRWQYYKPAR